MNRNLIPLDPPALIRSEDDLISLAAQINAAHEAGEGATRHGLEHFRNAGDALLKAKERCGHGKWLKWLEKYVKFSAASAKRYMMVAKRWDEVKSLTVSDLNGALRVLTTDVADENEPPIPEYVTLAQWNEAGADVPQRWLEAKGDSKFNDQGDNDNIEWALRSWNPVTGCEHNCPYCYARDIAERFYTQKFAPSIWPGRLAAPQNTPFPEEKAAQWMGHKNVFTCSMADLFGRWVPTEWIEAVLAAARAAPQWNFLFLTKFPQRMAEFDFPDNAWVGTTVDSQARVKNAEKAFRKIKARVKWLSCEPLIDPLVFSDLGAFDWLVLGGASRSRETPEWHPPRAWVVALEEQAAALGVSVYEKTNLLARQRGYPGAPDVQPTEAPPSLQYLPGETRP